MKRSAFHRYILHVDTYVHICRELVPPHGVLHVVLYPHALPQAGLEELDQPSWTCKSLFFCIVLIKL